MNLATKFTLTLPIEFEGEGGEMGRATPYFEMGAKHQLCLMPPVSHIGHD